MIKPGPTYKMSRTDKIMLASYVDRNKRSEVKRTVIQADLYGRQYVSRPKDRDQNNK